MAKFIRVAILYLDWKTVLLAICVFLLISVINQRRGRKFPPGPLGLPYIGNLLSLVGQVPEEALIKLSKHYGSVVGLQLGVFPVVVLNDYESIKEAFVKSGDKFADRPRLVLFDRVTKGLGIVGGYHGNGQREQRRFGMSVLRSLGMGKTSFEKQINEEVDAFVDYIKKRFCDVSFNPAHVIHISVSNVTCTIIYGRRYDYDDTQFLDMLEILDRRVELTTSPSAINFLPLLQYLPHKKFEAVVNNEIALFNFQNAIFKEHLDGYDPGNPRDFIDVYRSEIAKNDEQGIVTSFNETNMAHVTSDLFTAGTETTATTLLWAMLYMSLHPDIQQKVQDELHEVVGAGNHPTKVHLPRLPYTEAVLLEIQRMGAIIPLSIPHAASVDTTFRGYEIKKGTIFMSNIFAVLRDQKIWTTPDVFDPNRFLNKNNEIIRREEFIPFGIGRRSCLGEQLAKMELFLFFTNIMMNFKIKPSTKKLQSKGRVKTAATRVPEPFEIILTSTID